MPGPDLALRQDRIEPLRHRRVERVGRDADTGEQADDERDRGCPVECQGTDVGARRLAVAGGQKCFRISELVLVLEAFGLPAARSSRA